jgi:hypothetical protein
LAEPPALRITCASPREMPKAAAGSMRASMHVTFCGEKRLVMGLGEHMRKRKRGERTDNVLLGGWKGEGALVECGYIFAVLLDEVVLDGRHDGGLVITVEYEIEHKPKPDYMSQCFIYIHKLNQRHSQYAN